MTSIHDAIASASRTMDARATRRRALVVLTDGIDTGSKLTPAEVSGIASSIDLPVYIVAVVQAIDDPRSRRQQPGAGRGAGGPGAVDRRDSCSWRPRRRRPAPWRGRSSTSFASSI